MLPQKGNLIFCSAANEGLPSSRRYAYPLGRRGSAAIWMGNVVQLSKISFQNDLTAAPRAAATLLITLVLIIAPGAVPGSG